MSDSLDKPFAQAARARDGFRDVHIKKVPEPIWRKARHNALASSLSFRDYVIHLLDQCQPCPPAERQTVVPAATATDSHEV